MGILSRYLDRLRGMRSVTKEPLRLPVAIRLDRLPVAQRLDDLPVAQRIDNLPVARQIADDYEPSRGVSDRETYGRRAGVGSVSQDRGSVGAGDVGAPIGEWWDVVSTWVYRFRFDPYPGETVGDMFTEFLDGAQVVYHDTPFRDWIEFFQSSSKGRWVNANCKDIGRPYELLKAPFRTVTKEMIADREPYGKLSPKGGLKGRMPVLPTS